MYKQRLEQLQSTLPTNAALITSKANIFYYTNFYYDPHERFVAIWVEANKKPIFICPEMEAPFVKHLEGTYTVITYNDEMNPYQLLLQSIGNVSTLETLGVEGTHLTLQRQRTLSQHLTCPFEEIDNYLMGMRCIKDEAEKKTIKEACRLADWAIQTGVERISEQETELSLLGYIEFALKQQGVRQMSFETICLSGANSALPHGVSGNTLIQKGDFVLFDLGVVVDGYCSDITRTVVYGQASAQQKEIYNTVLAAETAAINAVKVNEPLGMLDKTARKVITDAGYGEFFPHRIGHGLGVLVHEPPSMDGTNTAPIQEGMVFTIEPGIYVPNVGGVRIEDDIFVGPNGPEVLTTFTKKLLEV
ncbi:MAG: M24 family metallopeptidase [Bacilli bacterium]